MEIKNIHTEKIVAEGLSLGETCQWIIDFSKEFSNTNLLHCIFQSNGSSELDLEEAIYRFDFSRPVLLPPNNYGDQYLVQPDWNDI